MYLSKSVPIASVPPAQPRAPRSAGLCTPQSRMFRSRAVSSRSSSRSFLSVPVILVGAVLLIAASARPICAADLAPGYIFEGYQIYAGISWVPELVPNQLPNVSRREAQMNFSKAENFPAFTGSFVAVAHGFLTIPRRGEYQFRLTSDDGSLLYIDDRLVIDNDGAHGAVAVKGRVQLSKGLHPFRVTYFDAGGADRLVLEWQPPRQKDFTPCPPALFRSAKNYDHKTSTGIKKVVSEREQVLTPDLARARAIDRGVAALLKEIEGRLIAAEATDKNEVGQAAFELYALLSSGVSIATPQVAQLLEFVDGNVMDKKNTYALSCAISAHEAAWSQLEDDLSLTHPKYSAEKISAVAGKAHRSKIERYTGALLSSQNPPGGWRYHPSDQDADVSCSQFAVLALGLASKRGVRIDDEVWERAAGFFFAIQAETGPETDLRLTMNPTWEKNQLRLEREELEASKKKSGRKKRGRTAVRPKHIDPVVGTEDREVFARGFAYNLNKNHGGNANNHWNRSCAALSSLLVIRDRWQPARRGEIHKKINEAIRDGFGWVMEEWNPYGSYYGIYSLEKVGDLGHIEKFGDHAWFEEASEWLVKEQGRRGRWPSAGMHGENSRCTTAFSLLVLSRATALLTRQGPSDRTIVTGRRAADAQEEGLERRSWVYLPDRDACIHLPALLRTLRYRPNRALVEFLVEVSGHYVEEYKPELVPALLDVRGRLHRKAMRKAVNRSLNEISGVELESDVEYRNWHGRWTEVNRALEGEEPLAKDRLLALYQDSTQGLVLRAAILRLSLKQQERAIVPHLIDDLDASTSDWRRRVHATLERFYPASLPHFDPQATASDRGKQVTAIREFWKQRSP